MKPFSAAFTAPTWQYVLVLIVGAILSPGRRTVAAALRVMGLDQDLRFTNYHRVLNRNRWSSLQLARCLCRLLVNTFVSDGPVVIGLDDTLEQEDEWVSAADDLRGQRGATGCDLVGEAHSTS